MSSYTFDPYHHHDSPIHRLDPRVKVVLTVLFIISNVILPDAAWAGFGLAWGLVLVVNFTARLSLLYLLKRSLIAFPFALAAITVIFTLEGAPLLTFSVLGWDLTVSDTGLLRFTSILIRSWLSVQMVILLTATTRFPDLMHALHHLRLPGVLVAIISFAYRYIFVLINEAQRLIRAREARSAQLTTGGGGGSILWRGKIAGNMVGQLFLRSYERSERVYNAMLSRGYQGHFLTLNPHVMDVEDWLIGGVGLLFITIIQAGGYF